MVRKLLYFVITAAILVCGYLAVKRLSYWERSVRIFKTGSIENYQGRTGRGGGEFRQLPDSMRQRFDQRGGERPFMREMPDSIRRQFVGGGRGRSGRTSWTMPDSTRREFREVDRVRSGREAAVHGSRGYGRDGGRVVSKVNLGNVWWFMAVFASFTVIALWCDKLYCYCRKKKVKV
jgi:hypothetical protein